MRCINCHKIIDLGLSPSESYNILHEMMNFNVVITCIKCTNELDPVADVPESDGFTVRELGVDM